MPELPMYTFALTDHRTDPQQLFKNIVEDEQLTGLVFREIYSVA